jgi:hypothetical protein
MAIRKKKSSAVKKSSSGVRNLPYNGETATIRNLPYTGGKPTVRNLGARVTSSGTSPIKKASSSKKMMETATPRKTTTAPNKTKNDKYHIY